MAKTMSCFPSRRRRVARRLWVTFPVTSCSQPQQHQDIIITSLVSVRRGLAAFHALTASTEDNCVEDDFRGFCQADIDDVDAMLQILTSQGSTNTELTHSHGNHAHRDVITRLPFCVEMPCHGDASTGHRGKQRMRSSEAAKTDERRSIQDNDYSNQAGQRQQLHPDSRQPRVQRPRECFICGALGGLQVSQGDGRLTCQTCTAVCRRPTWYASCENGPFRLRPYINRSLLNVASGNASSSRVHPAMTSSETCHPAIAASSSRLSVTSTTKRRRYGNRKTRPVVPCRALLQAAASSTQADGDFITETTPSKQQKRRPLRDIGEPKQLVPPGEPPHSTMINNELFCLAETDVNHREMRKTRPTGQADIWHSSNTSKVECTSEDSSLEDGKEPVLISWSLLIDDTRHVMKADFKDFIGNRLATPCEEDAVITNSNLSIRGSHVQKMTSWMSLLTLLHPRTRRVLLLKPAVTMEDCFYKALIQLLANLFPSLIDEISFSAQSSTGSTRTRGDCARSQPCCFARKPRDTLAFLGSKHRKVPDFLSDFRLTTLTRLNLDKVGLISHGLQRFDDTSPVWVYRSNIHGRGVYATRVITRGTTVLEYTGELIRSSVAESREKKYDRQGVDCYMFRLDESTVIDATFCGSAARFINHSCDANCCSRRRKDVYRSSLNGSGSSLNSSMSSVSNSVPRIYIVASRTIAPGEELTYDYKFPLEDQTNGRKLGCACGARRCRKYLN